MGVPSTSNSLSKTANLAMSISVKPLTSDGAAFLSVKKAGFVDRERSGGGALIDIGVHALDCIWWLMNSPRPVEVMGTSYSHFGHLVPDDVKYDVDDGTFAHILFENGATIILETTWALNLPGDNYIKIAGTKAGATLNPLYALHGRKRQGSG